MKFKTNNRLPNKGFWVVEYSDECWIDVTHEWEMVSEVFEMDDVFFGVANGLSFKVFTSLLARIERRLNFCVCFGFYPQRKASFGESWIFTSIGF